MSEPREPILQFFEPKAGMPVQWQTLEYIYIHMAELIVSQVPRNPERSVALRKLLESKDAAFRALIFTE